jgi:hypothetical protein
MQGTDNNDPRHYRLTPEEVAEKRWDGYHDGWHADDWFGVEQGKTDEHTLASADACTKSLNLHLQIMAQTQVSDGGHHGTCPERRRCL